MDKKVSFYIDNKEIIIGNCETEENLLIHSAVKYYNVKFTNDENVFNELNKKFRNNLDCLLIDLNVYEIYKEYLDIDIKRIFIIDAIENNKTLEGCTNVLDFLFESSFNKGGIFYSVGGGIIQDISAFVSSTYKRGIDWTFYPTTLLSMADSCIGGKSSINYKTGKNQLGLFSAPNEIYINTLFLKSLNIRELHSGLGEILKLHIIGGNYFLAEYKRYVSNGCVISFPNYFTLIYNSLLIKKEVIQIDEFDKSYRKALNYGHSVGHVLEKLTDFKIPHGQAVSIGIIVANILNSSKDHKLIDEMLLKIIDEKCIDTLKLVNFDDFLNLLKNDKKVLGNKMSFIYCDNLNYMKTKQIELNESLIIKLSKIILTI